MKQRPLDDDSSSGGGVNQGAGCGRYASTDEELFEKAKRILDKRKIET